MTLVELARLAVKTYVRDGRVLKPAELKPDLALSKKRAGAFVTIEKNGELRGCIGTYLATRKNLAQEVIYNAVAAATQDPRFPIVSKGELPDLCYTVYILGEPELVADLNELDPVKYGIIVKALENPRKAGLLLPDLKGVDSPQEQVAIACQKGGINPEKDSLVIYRFKAEKYQ